MDDMNPYKDIDDEEGMVIEDPDEFEEEESY